jgi:hypothetical protein
MITKKKIQNKSTTQILINIKSNDEIKKKKKLITKKITTTKIK